MSDVDVLKALNALHRHGELPLFYTKKGKHVFLPDLSLVKTSDYVVIVAVGSSQMELSMDNRNEVDDFIEQWKRAKLWYASR